MRSAVVDGRPPLGREGLDMMSKPPRSRLIVSWHHAQRRSDPLLRPLAGPGVVPQFEIRGP